MKRRILSALCALVMAFLLAVPAYAAGGVELDRLGSISIHMSYEEEAVPGGSLTLYRVADVWVEYDADYSFRYTDEFVVSQVELDLLDSAQTARQLADYVKAAGISGTKQEIDDNGDISFADLSVGLYLLVQEDAAEGYNPVNAFLVSLPGQQNGSYVYEVDAAPKVQLEKAPEPDNPPPPDLPQTGLNKWPVPVLAIAGLLLAALGAVLCVSGKKNAHEK